MNDILNLFLQYFYLFFVTLMLSQGILNTYLTLYIWQHPERLARSKSPKYFREPKNSFTVMLPALHEEDVLGDTIKRVSDVNYPEELFEIHVILQPKDTGTIAAAEESIKKNNITNAKVLLVDMDHKPLNKPYQLNYSLERTKMDHIVIFDSEDEVHPDILNIANTIYLNERADVIQCGVQLMNYSDTWFGGHNCLEYFFWFKSRLHYQARENMVPLGGNTVFMKTAQLNEINGWDENCLTEDAEIGIRLTASGKKVYTTYDSKHITKEETPSNVEQFIKQRTRWNQGFLQALKKGEWKKYDTLKKKALSVYILAFPFFQAFSLIVTPFIIYLGFTLEMAFIFSLYSFLPLMMLLIQLAISLVGLHEFTTEQGHKFKLKPYIVLAVTFLPYQFLLSAGAIRGIYREIKGFRNWEKTDHSGAHRKETIEVTT